MKNRNIHIGWRKIAAVLLTVSIFSCSVHLDEMVKLPALVIHFNQHKEANNDTTIFDFLYAHYMTNIQKEQPGHESLPFKSLNSFISHISLFQTSFTEMTIKNFHVVTLIFPDQGTKSIQGHSFIWQPPQLV